MATNGYQYEDLKPDLFTDEGQRRLLKGRDLAFKMLRRCGAFRGSEWMDEFTKAEGAAGSWEMLAVLDRLVELGDIERLYRDPKGEWTQFACYTTPERSNR